MTAVSSDQAPSRHTWVAAYCCSVPRLTRFTGPCCARPDRQHHLQSPAAQNYCLNWGVSPRYSGLRIQGTAASPVSTTGLLYYKSTQVSRVFLKFFSEILLKNVLCGGIITLYIYPKGGGAIEADRYHLATPAHS